MRNLFHVATLLFFLTLGGCQSTPKITQGYDEFKNIKTCQTDKFRIKYEPGFTEYRDTSLAFEKVDSTTIRISIVNEFNAKNSDAMIIKNGAKLKFRIYKKDNSFEDLIFIGSDQRNTTIPYSYRTQYGTVHCTKEESLVFFNISVAELKKVINTAKVEFNFEVSIKPIRGTLNDDHIKFFVAFFNECFSKE